MAYRPSPPDSPSLPRDRCLQIGNRKGLIEAGLQTVLQAFDYESWLHQCVRERERLKPRRKRRVNGGALAPEGRLATSPGHLCNQFEELGERCAERLFNPVFGPRDLRTRANPLYESLLWVVSSQLQRVVRSMSNGGSRDASRKFTEYHDGDKNEEADRKTVSLKIVATDGLKVAPPSLSCFPNRLGEGCSSGASRKRRLVAATMTHGQRPARLRFDG
jgi:hypothetical protein